MKKSTVFISAVCALIFAQSALFAQASPIVSGNTNPSLKAPITLNAREASLSEVLRVLADRSGMNFVVAEGVHREKISIILNNTPLDEAINLLVRASGLSYEIIGNSILIAEADKLKEEVGLSSYVVELKYAKAEEVAASLGDLSKSIKVDKGGNRLICFTSPRMILEIERIVKAIDQPHILVMLETRLVEVRMDKLGKYGVDWETLTSSNNGLIAGISTPQKPLKSGLNFNGTMRSEMNLTAILNLMERNGDARLLTNAKLTTTNNRQAELHIGEVIPYIIQSYNLSSSGGANLQVEKERIGTMLTMTPYINDDNQITLSLQPEVSTISGWRGDIPMVNVRKTSSTVRVEDGQTVILAGLLQETTLEETRKLPVLGSIPLIGLLFQNKVNESVKKNLIIEVIPRIIHDPAQIASYMRTESNKANRKAAQTHKSELADVAPVQAAAPVPVPVAAEAVQPVPAAAAEEAAGASE